MVSVIVYFQEQQQLDTQKTLQEMKKLFLKQDWKFKGLFVDKKNDYDVLQQVILNYLKETNIIYLYSKNNIDDEFYWQLLNQTANIEKVEIKFYSDFDL